MAESRRRKPAGPNKKGKVLKVRLGYNANSSSLSVIVSLLMLGSAAAATVLGMISATLFTKEKKAGSGGAADGK
jgi:hypothetical protein